jgi:hypothetical protein
MNISEMLGDLGREAHKDVARDRRIFFFH